MLHDPPSGGASTPVPAPSRCLHCGTETTNPSEVVSTREGAFCRSCFASLKQQLEQALRGQSTDINYPAAALGGLLGGVLGVLAWWGFTVLTKISFGLVAVVIGYAVGHGVIRFSGNKRSTGLQGLSVGLAGLAFFYAQYLVSRTFLLGHLRDQGAVLDLPLLPDAGTFLQVIRAGLGLFDLVFLAIVVFQAWRIPAPARIRVDAVN